MQCPKCKLHNPDEAMRCDCGYDFDSGEMKDSYIKDSYAKPTKGLVVCGWIFAVLGGLIGILIASYIAFGKDAGGFKYDLPSRKNAKAMLIVAITIMAIGILSRFSTFILSMA